MYSPFFVPKVEKKTTPAEKAASPLCSEHADTVIRFLTAQHRALKNIRQLQFHCHLIWKIVEKPEWQSQQPITARHPYGDYPYSQQQVQVQLALGLGLGL